jgi:hypothetical protein
MDEAKQELPHQAIAVAEDLLKHVDLERLGGYASAATAAVVLLRRHPWLMVAAGATLAAMGAWQISRRHRARQEEEVTYLQSGPTDNGSTHRD